MFTDCGKNEKKKNGFNKRNMKLKIYTLSWCGHCKALKEFLNYRKVEFENIDVEKDENAAEEIIQKAGSSGFPVIELDGRLIVGFDAEELSKILGEEK